MNVKQEKESQKSTLFLGSPDGLEAFHAVTFLDIISAIYFFFSLQVVLS